SFPDGKEGCARPPPHGDERGRRSGRRGPRRGRSLARGLHELLSPDVRPLVARLGSARGRAGRRAASHDRNGTRDLATLAAMAQGLRISGSARGGCRLTVGKRSVGGGPVNPAPPVALSDTVNQAGV